jgi:Protein of unknown function (DUF3723)
MKESPDPVIARAALLTACKLDRFEYDDSIFDDLVMQIAGLFSRVTPVKSERPRLARLADGYNKRKSRSGLPQVRTHKEDRMFLFIPNLHIENIEQAEEITTFDVRRSVYFAFFDGSCATGYPSHQQPSDIQLTNSVSQTPHLARLGHQDNSEAQKDAEMSDCPVLSLCSICPSEPEDMSSPDQQLNEEILASALETEITLDGTPVGL